MKKLAIIVLAAILALNLIACNNATPPSSSDNSEIEALKNEIQSLKEENEQLKQSISSISNEEINKSPDEDKFCNLVVAVVGKNNKEVKSYKDLKYELETRAEKILNIRLELIKNEKLSTESYMFIGEEYPHLLEYADDIEKLDAELETIEHQLYKEIANNFSEMVDGNKSANDQSGRFIELELTISNKFDKDIKGISGYIEILDVFENHIMTVSSDFTDTSLPSKSSSSYVVSIDFNQFIDAHIKIANNSYEDMTFKYYTTAVIFIDGEMLK